MLVYFMENPIQMNDDWGYPCFRKSPHEPAKLLKPAWLMMFKGDFTIIGVSIGAFFLRYQTYGGSILCLMVC